MEMTIKQTDKRERILEAVREEMKAETMLYRGFPTFKLYKDAVDLVVKRDFVEYNITEKESYEIASDYYRAERR